MDRFRWAERRDGLLTTDVLRLDGASKRQIERARRRGELRAVRRGVVAVNGSPRTWRQEVRAVLLAGGDVIAASSWTALRLLGGEVPADVDRIHVVGPARRQVTLDGVVGHRSATLEDEDVITIDGMRCTSPLRTVIDLSGAADVRLLGRIVDDLVRRRLLDLDELRGRANRLRPAPGRSVATLRRVLALRVPGYDPGESELEARIARVLARAGLPTPAQQHRISYGAARYRLDMAWPEHKLYLEGNGFGFHRLASDLDRDARRQNDLVLDGWRPIEVTWRMSDGEIAATVRRFLALPRP